MEIVGGHIYKISVFVSGLHAVAYESVAGLRNQFFNNDLPASTPKH